MECAARGLDPLKTNLVVADEERTGKTICLSHVTLHGVAESVSSIQETNATDARLLQTIYYDICGVQLHSAPESGIYLEKNCYSDGRVSVLKKLK